MSNKTSINSVDLNKEQFVTQILNDYRIVFMSREASLIGRKEVISGKAKFGIFGDGKELPQLVMSKFFKNGDFRSGYYRDQTFMMAKVPLLNHHTSGVRMEWYRDDLDAVKRS